MNELTYEFDDLPAFTDLGFEVGSFSGEATIRYDNTGEWSIGEIWLEGSKFDKQSGKWERRLIPLCEKSHWELYLSILDQLESGKIADWIKDEVIEALEQDGVRLVPDRIEHSTHYAAFSGV
jgi:hypothetical protein